MTIILLDHYQDRAHVLKGTRAQVLAQVLLLLPMFREAVLRHEVSLEDLVEVINASQPWSAWVELTDRAHRRP